MIQPLQKRLQDNCIVLEPSCWKGDILKVIADNNNYRRAKLYGIEQEQELAEISKKYCRIIGDDFLTFDNDIDFDIIIMNPPFENGDEHFLKAWDIMRNGEIVCLLNAETLLNPYSERRKTVLKIIEDNKGSIEYIDDAFTTAERKTGVQTALVRIQKKTESSNIFWTFETEKIDFEEIVNKELATRDNIGNIIKQYEQAKEAYANGLTLISQANALVSWICNNYNLKPYEIAGKGGTVKQRVQTFTEELKYGIWNKIVDELKIEKYMTEKVREWFREKMKSQGNIAISKKNIQDFVQVIIENSWTILEESIQTVFDEFTKYHDENREYQEGWKTNSKWKVNKKIILPNGVVYSRFCDWKFELPWNNQSKFGDIDKCMCFIAWVRYEEAKTIEKALKEAFNIWATTCESQFFSIRFFKKGTIHIEFKDKFLWQEFNMRATAWRAWLPEKEEKAWKSRSKFI